MTFHLVVQNAVTLTYIIAYSQQVLHPSHLHPVVDLKERLEDIAPSLYDTSENAKELMCIIIIIKHNKTH